MSVARTLHWLTVLLVAIQFVIGWTMPDVHKDTQPVNLIAWHPGVGATLVAVMAIRVIWRLTHWPTPDELPRLLSVVSRIAHVCRQRHGPASCYSSQASTINALRWEPACAC
ncbi:cytochrome b [Paraburkholderia sp. HD33-4]|uniref:cytochrome b n=1 Tax=Paraburkholderia sp. HD33-4 TaxID=2883242 RepID=UPI002277B7A8|nr:cytochrome b/b6 domain-containing protein [Paraburkholderia sp. HD33-4]